MRDQNKGVSARRSSSPIRSWNSGTSRTACTTKAIEAIDDDAWTAVHYPGAVEDPDTGPLISDAEVAETSYTLTVRGRGRVTARLVVRRVRDANYPDALFPVWRYHPFFTNSDLPTIEADLTHRKHAIVETTFADLIAGPLAHLPSWRASNLPDCGPNRVRFGKESRSWHENTRNTSPSSVTR